VSGVFALILASPLVASDRFLQEAFSEERVMVEVSERISRIHGRQMDSNVFSENEMEDVKETGTTFSSVKEKQMRRIIEELGKSTRAASAPTARGHREAARGEYREAIAILASLKRFGSQEELRRRMSTRALIEDQRQLLAETRDLQEEQNAKGALDEDDMERSWDLAEKQRALQFDAPDDGIRKQMRDAATTLQNMDIPQAIRRQEHLLDELQRALDEGFGEMFGRAEDLSMAALMEQSLADLADRLSNANKQDTPMNSRLRQEMATEMGEQANKMAEAKPLKKAMMEMNEGIMDLMRQQDQQALEHVQQALQQVRQNRQQMANQMQAQQQNAPQDDQLQAREETAEATAEQAPTGTEAVTGKRKTPEANADWKARLPPKERDALLAARKAKYLPEMEAEVKKYFVDLAK